MGGESCVSVQPMHLCTLRSGPWHGDADRGGQYDERWVACTSARCTSWCTHMRHRADVSMVAPHAGWATKRIIGRVRSGHTAGVARVSTSDVLGWSWWELIDVRLCKAIKVVRVFSLTRSGRGTRVEARHVPRTGRSSRPAPPAPRPPPPPAVPSPPPAHAAEMMTTSTSGYETREAIWPDARSILVTILQDQCRHVALLYVDSRYWLLHCCALKLSLPLP